jgi:hypothetical protein
MERKEKMNLHLGTVKEEVIERRGLSLEGYAQKVQTQLKRIYLLSKAQVRGLNITCFFLIS